MPVFCFLVTFLWGYENFYTNSSSVHSHQTNETMKWKLIMDQAKSNIEYFNIICKRKRKVE